jgi:hypothetical protein
VPNSGPPSCPVSIRNLLLSCDSVTKGLESDPMFVSYESGCMV